MPIKTDSSVRALSVDERVGLLKALADSSRFLVVNALVERSHCVEELAERLRRAPSTISFHLRKLEEAGLVEKTKTQYYLRYALRPDLLRMTLRELLTLPDSGNAPIHKQQYRDQVVRTFFRDGSLLKLPKQWRKRMVVLDELANKFTPGESYSEPEVNQRIQTLHPDYCTLRRMLIEEGYMTRDGQTYTMLEKGGSSMETRSELKRKYRETAKQAGIFQVRNTASGKILLGSSLNLHGPLNKHRFMLSTSMHPNRALQRDWNALGADSFILEIVEVVPPQDDAAFSLQDELTLLEQIWLEKLPPLGEGSYHENARIRE